MTIDEIEKIPMVFIVGVARSGTTLLRSVMDSGYDTVFPIESSLIIHLKKKYFHGTKWNKEKINEFLDDLYGEVKFARYWNVERNKLTEFIRSFPLEKLNFPTLIKLIYLSFPSGITKSNKIHLIGDKNPSYSIFIDDLMEVFSSAKFIHITRDYRDCILSNRTTFKRQNLFALAQMWKIHNRSIDSYSKKYPDRFLKIKYEDLAGDPQSEIRRISIFTGVEMNYAMLGNQQQMKEGLNPDLVKLAEHTHPKVFEEIKPYNVGKWKEGLNASEKIQIAYVLNNFGTRYGYERLNSYKGEKFIFRSAVGFWMNMMDVSVVRTYFLLPHWVRRTMTKITQRIFDKTGFYTVYNQDNVLVDIYKKNKSKAENK